MGKKAGGGVFLSFCAVSFLFIIGKDFRITLKLSLMLILYILMILTCVNSVMESFYLPKSS